MITHVKSSFVSAPPELIFAHCTCLKGFRQLFPFRVDWRGGPEEWTGGDTLDFRYRCFGVWIPHVARIVEWEPGRRFTDEMVHGVFRAFRHTHLFHPMKGGTVITDEVEFCVGCGACADAYIAKPIIERSFRNRHHALQAFFGTEVSA